MAERVEGIARGEQISSVKSMQKSHSEREEEILEEKGIKEPLDKNELSADEMRDELEDKIDDMNNIMETLEEQLNFKLHEDTERLMVQIINIGTKEVLKEMPPEEMLDLAARINHIVGLIIDEKV